MNSRSKSRRKKTNRNLDSHPDSLFDSEQKATQNLFNFSDFADQINYEKDFNGIFDMFRSVDLDSKVQKQQKKDKKYPRLDKFNSTVCESKKYREKYFQKEKNQLQESKYLIKYYESQTEQDSSKNQTLRIRKQKIFDKISERKGITLACKPFKSDSVFVAKNNRSQSMATVDEKTKKLQRFFNLKNNQNSLIFKKQDKISHLKKITDLTLQSPKQKPQGLYQEIFRTVKTLSPQPKTQSILLECSQIHRLESLYTVRPLSKTTLGPCSGLKQKGEDKIYQKSMEKTINSQLYKTVRLNKKKELLPTRYNQTKRKKVFF